MIISKTSQELKNDIPSLKCEFNTPRTMAEIFDMIGKFYNGKIIAIEQHDDSNELVYQIAITDTK